MSQTHNSDCESAAVNRRSVISSEHAFDAIELDRETGWAVHGAGRSGEEHPGVV